MNLDQSTIINLRDKNWNRLIVKLATKDIIVPIFKQKIILYTTGNKEVSKINKELTCLIPQIL
jgi:hypothetical protein